MSSPSPAARRPAGVAVVLALVILAGVVVVAAGIAIVVERGNDLVQLPALMARLDESLPFDEEQDLDTYLAGVGAVVAVIGVVQVLLAWMVLRGRAWAYVALLVLLVALAGAAGWVRSRTDDDLESLGTGLIAGSAALLAVLLLALLVGHRSRAWVLGRRESL
jgi:hypothetical protein